MIINSLDQLFELDDYRKDLLEGGELEAFLKTYALPVKIRNKNSSTFWDTRLKGEKYVNNYMKKDRINIISSYINKLNPKKILNIGVGDGDLERHLKQSISKVGIDITHKGLERLTEIENFLPICASINDLPIKSQSFEVVTVLEVLEHLIYSSTFSVLEQISRKLTNNGLLIISVPINETYNEKFNPNHHYRRYHEQILIQELIQSDFEIIKTWSLYAFSNMYPIKKYLAKTVLNKRWKPNVLIVISRKKPK